MDRRAVQKGMPPSASDRAGGGPCPRCGAAPVSLPRRAARPDAAGNSRSSRPRFSTFARAISRWSGRSAAFAASLLIVVAWLVTGPLFDYSDTWQLIINTSTTIITFWMVFVIQHTQNRDTEAMQLKLDEIIRATRGAQNALIDLEDADDEELETYRRRYAVAAAAARAALDRGVSDTGRADAGPEAQESSQSEAQRRDEG
jgi:low affinity Fe/Cu permease